MAKAIELDDRAAEELGSRLRGGLLRPRDEGYESARKVYNGMIDRRPALIARCVDVADVIAAVRFAGERGLDLAVRGGGHNGAGLGTCEGGLVVDLSPMRGVVVDPASATAGVAGGCVLGDVDHATHPFGLALPMGFISTTGVGGLTLGGGIGHLTRRFGLTVDSLLGADVVLHDGALVHADEEHHPDLFWALRGGGGNFGVVTSFHFRLHPVSTVMAGPMLWEMDRATEAMAAYRDLMRDAPEEVNGFFAFLTVPPAPPFPEHLWLRPMCGVVWCCADGAAATDRMLGRARELAPVLDGVQRMPLPVLQSAFDPLYPPGLQWYWRADFANELGDEAIRRHVEQAADLPTPLSTMHLYPIDGAAHRVGPEDTAFRFRDARFAEVIVGVDPDPAEAERIRSWTVRYWEALHPFSAGGAYVNFLMDEGEDRVRATYGANYPRLAAIKRRYDPGNLFHVNQNIRPAA
ncbi:MAG TPA: FAD-binding oxidoreductase [Candidatus Dormibacteraeota bacterium]|nr:FAD-binding oxidoreductase [Candidatus Dormibacteraeota bacterium]